MVHKIKEAFFLPAFCHKNYYTVKIKLLLLGIASCIATISSVLKGGVIWNRNVVIITFKINKHLTFLVVKWVHKYKYINTAKLFNLTTMMNNTDFFQNWSIDKANGSFSHNSIHIHYKQRYQKWLHCTTSTCNTQLNCT